ncbi:MAG: hypothetical protein WEC72_00920 [Chthoniobacterales bacterium]
MRREGEVRVELSADGKLLGRPGQAERIRELVAAGKLRCLRVTFVPRVVGGAKRPTLTGDPCQALLGRAVKLRLKSMQPKGSRCEAVYVVASAGIFLSQGLRKR